MRIRLLAMVLLAVAAALYLGVSRPHQREADDLGAQYRRARDEQRAAEAQLREAEHIKQRRELAARVLARPSGPLALAELRRFVVGQVRDARVSAVRIEVATTGRAGALTAKLSAEGGFLDLAALAARLAQPGAGLALQEVHLTPVAAANPAPAGRAKLEVSVIALGARS